MPVPTYDQFIDPLLRFLARHPEGAVARRSVSEVNFRYRSSIAESCFAKNFDLSGYRPF
jgi:hypothetical protein